MENQGHPRSKSSWESELASSERKDHQDLAPLALSPDVGTGDTQIALATFREIKQVGEHHRSHIGKGYCYEVRCTFQESEGWSLGSQRCTKILCCSGDMLKPPVFEGSDEKDLCSKPSSTHSLRVLRMTSVQPKGVLGLKPPYYLGRDGPHGHPTGLVASQLIGYRPLSGAWSSNITCHFGWQIFCLIPFVHINFVLKKSNSSLSFVVCGFGSRSKKSWPNPKSWSFSLMFSYMGCIILVLTYRPLIHFELILNSEGNRDPMLFFCMWDLVVPASVLIVGENICKWCHQKGLISKIHKQHMNLKKIIKIGQV